MKRYQRARNEKQRTERRQSILQTAAAMLNEMPVSALSLNELSRRVGLGARDSLVGLAALLQRLLPALDGDRSARAARVSIVLADALWTRSHPAPAVLAAIAADPSLAFFSTPFAEAFETSLKTFLMGLLVEGSDERLLRDG